MTTTTTEIREAAPAAEQAGYDGVPTSLEHLVGDADAFFRDHWANQPVLLRAHSDLTRLITEQEMWDEVECGLLSRPYFTIFNEGVRTAISDMTRKRRVVGHELTGYIEPERIREDFAAKRHLQVQPGRALAPAHPHPRQGHGAALQRRTGVLRLPQPARQDGDAGSLRRRARLHPPGRAASRTGWWAASTRPPPATPSCTRARSRGTAASN
ncbi:hypothetical protein ACQ4WX_01780 [Streptomyces lasalocidi]